MRPSIRIYIVFILGIVIVLFFQCLDKLLNPIHRTGGTIRWPLVAHTVAMFSFVTILEGMNLNIQSVSYINNREFPGTDQTYPGPFGFLAFSYSKMINIIPTLTFLLNNLLADGLLVSSVSDQIV